MSKPDAKPIVTGATATRTIATTRIENGKPKFVYVIYIAAPIERVWQALTDPKLTEQYWFGYRLKSDWEVGSHYVVDKDGVPPFDKGIVLECDPPRRLSYTWHPQYQDVLHEPHSRVTFELVPFESEVQLTVIHDEFEPGSKVFESISGGWPKVLSSLKSLLEKGQGLTSSFSDVVRQREASLGRSS